MLGTLSELKEFFLEAMPVPQQEQWRIGLLAQYVEVRNSLMPDSTETEYIDALIENLCTT